MRPSAQIVSVGVQKIAVPSMKSLYRSDVHERPLFGRLGVLSADGTEHVFSIPHLKLGERPPLRILGGFRACEKLAEDRLAK